uniref:Phosphatidylinositol-specific phospholipase C X domain-containing protein n=1 Tax=Oryzias latipes TaxID=8090 RepID=A0A3P9L353_ORYLA
MVTHQPATEEQPKPQPQTSITPTTAQEPTTTTTPQSNGQTMKKDENEKYPPSPPIVLPGKPKLPTETGLDNTDWMTSIPDETPLSTITIVGIRLLFGKKQVWTMKQKLKDGIRYFDINVGVWRATEKEYHIRSTKWIVEEVLLPISIFLRTHSHETVLLRLTIHGRTKTIVDDFTNTSTGKFKDIMWTKRSVPTMKEARGKIVFLKTKSFHFGAKNHKSKNLDLNMLKNFEKKIELQKSDICGGQLVVTESLASDQESLEQLTKLVQKYFSGYSDFGCLGIISMDNPSPELIEKIIHLKPCNCGQKLEIGSKRPHDSSSQTEETKLPTDTEGTPP